MRFGITQVFPCSYLANRHEQLLVYAEEDTDLALRYSQLIQAGFRRSGDQVYRPHCPQCDACQSVRVLVNTFTPSRSQKRVIRKNSHLHSVLSYTPGKDYYPLYEHYICERHADGSMFPPSRDQFDSFIDCQWKQPVFIEAYDDDKLIAVAVTDIVDDRVSHSGMSALYTFFDPAYSESSIGTWMILQQLQHARTMGIDYLYLGYQVDACPKMAYKTRFLPHERFYHNKWHRIDKKTV
ncbi:arginyltransferase [Alteromonas antoniana]|uniref:arginyltransferase n=1 Tax=Alteromonas antoniana TaxID=2803813 RepID=UPI001C48D28C|nr:arginyltransferase [Alteromonas antoniana]